MSAEIHVGDVGTVFVFTVTNENDVAVDLSGATTKSIIFSKPDGSTVTKSASFYTSGTDGILTYTTTTGDLDQPGNWRSQAYVILASGKWYSSFGEFAVTGNL